MIGNRISRHLALPQSASITYTPYSLKLPAQSLHRLLSSSISMTKPSSFPRMERHTPTRTVLVLGASYAGHRAIQQLVTFLPLNWKVVVLERNTHFNHLYAFPRMSVVPGHEQKIFIPYSRLFQPLDEIPSATDNELIHGCLTSLSQSDGHNGELPLGRGVARYTPLSADSSKPASSSTHEVPFDYLVYALGSQLPPPINLWSTPKKSKAIISEPLKVPEPANTNGSAQTVYDEVIAIPQTRGTKAAGTKWLQETQEQIRNADSVLVIGGGALGVQYASDIAYTYGTPTSPPRWTGHSTPPRPKKVTLLSSSPHILPRFKPWMHQEGVRSLEALGVEVITGSRADLNTLGDANSGESRKIKTLDGREIEANVVLFCTGQRPNTEMLQSFGNVLDPKTGMASVTKYLQLSPKDTKADQESFNHVFVIGDAADAFGALNAGHSASAQAEVAARNISRLVALEEQTNENSSLPWLNTPLEAYEPDPHKIKVSVGFERYINENNGNHKILTNGTEDLNAVNMWLKRGLDTGDLAA